MASHDSENLQLRQEEIDILNSIYIDELLITEKCGIAECIEIVLHPATAGQAHEQYVCLTLILHIPQAYPHAEPIISIKNPRGISDEFVDSLKRTLDEHATENLGNQVLFTLIQHAKDSLTHNNTPSCNCAVCLTGFQDDDAFTKTECYHYFHVSCLERYIDVCTKDHEKEVAEIEESRMPQQKKELKIVCPVCREPISYVSDLETKGVGAVNSVKDDSFEPDESMRRWQEEMKKLYNKQKEKGGIIDLEAESNRFLLDISTTVSTPSLSTIPPGNDRICSAPKSEYRDKRNTVHSKSRRENYHKYGNRSYRDGEPQRQQSDKEHGRYENGGNDNASMDKSCEELSSVDTKSVTEDSTKPNKIQDVLQDEIGRNQAPEELPDLNECEEELKEETDHQLNCSVSEKAESSEQISDIDSTTQKKLIDTEQEKDVELDGNQSGQIDEKKIIQTDRRTQNEKRNVQDNRRSKSGYNHEQKRGRNNHYYRTGERKFGNWRKRDENNCTKDENHRSEDSMAKNQHHHRSGGATAGSQNQRRSGGASHHQRRSEDATAGSQHQRRNGGSMARSQQQYRSGGGSQYQRRNGGSTAESQHQRRNGGSTAGSQHQRRSDGGGQYQRRNSGSTAESQQQYRSGGGTARKNISESSEIKGLEKKQDVSDGLLKEVLNGSNDNNTEQGIGHKKTHSARNPTSRKEDDNSRCLRENKPIKKDGQSITGHQRYRNQRYQKSPKKFPVDAGKKPNIEDHVQHSVVAKQHNRNDNFQRDCSKLRTRSDVSKEAAAHTDDSKQKSIPREASLDGPVANPPCVPPGFKSKTEILPPPGFD